MWLALPGYLLGGAADGVASPQNVSLYIVGGIAALASVLAAYLAMRGTFRTADSQREAAFDKRVDDRLTRIEERLEIMTADRDRYREMHAELRVAVRKRGMDPDNMGGPPGAAPQA